MKTRIEKITYLKALQSGDKAIIKQIENEHFFKTLSDEELTKSKPD